MDDDLDYDQSPDVEPDIGGRLIYDQATKRALKAVIEAIDGGASAEDVRNLCARGIEALGRDDE